MLFAVLLGTTIESHAIRDNIVSAVPNVLTMRCPSSCSTPTAPPPSYGGGMLFLASLGPTTASVLIQTAIVIAMLSCLAERCSSSLPSPLASLSPLRARSFESYASSLSVFIRLTPTLDADASSHHVLVGADPDQDDDALAGTAVVDAPRALSRAVRSLPARLHLVSQVARPHADMRLKQPFACVAASLVLCALPNCVLNPQLEQRLGALSTLHMHSCAASACTSSLSARANATLLIDLGVYPHVDAPALTTPTTGEPSLAQAVCAVPCTYMWSITFTSIVTEQRVLRFGALGPITAASRYGGDGKGTLRVMPRGLLPARVLIVLDARVKGHAGRLLACDYPTARGTILSIPLPLITQYVTPYTTPYIASAQLVRPPALNVPPLCHGGVCMCMDSPTVRYGVLEIGVRKSPALIS